MKLTYKRLALLLVMTVVGLFTIAVATPAFAENPNAGCDQTPYEAPGQGANRPGAYDDTCDGSASENGNGNGKAVGKPCAGCVGNADEKNPPGQDPDGTDDNNGYECDENNGVGKSNPAHTGCAPATDDDDEPEVDDNVVTNPDDDTEVLGVRLARTGSPNLMLALFGVMFIVAGVGARRRATVS